MNKAEIQAKIKKIEKNSFIPDKLKKIKINELNKQLEGLDKSPEKQSDAKRAPVSRRDRDFKVDDVVYDKKHKSIGIIREISDEEILTNAYGSLKLSDLEHYNRSDVKHQKAKVESGTRSEIENRNLATLESKKNKSKPEEIYIYQEKEYTKQELIDFANTSNEYDRRDASTDSDDIVPEITTWPEARKWLTMDGETVVKKGSKEKSLTNSGKKSKLSGPFSTLKETLTSIGIDMDGEDEARLAGLRIELEDIDNDSANALSKIKNMISEFETESLPQIDQKHNKEIKKAFSVFMNDTNNVKIASKPKATYKGKPLKELNEENCQELLKENRDRMESAKKSAKKSKSKPVIEKITANVVKAAKKAIENVSVEDIKNNPNKELGLMDKVISATKKYLNELKTILGDDWDSEAITDEIKPLVDLVKDLRKKYDE